MQAELPGYYPSDADIVRLVDEGLCQVGCRARITAALVGGVWLAWPTVRMPLSDSLTGAGMGMGMGRDEPAPVGRERSHCMHVTPELHWRAHAHVLACALQARDKLRQEVVSTSGERIVLWDHLQGGRSHFGQHRIKLLRNVQLQQAQPLPSAAAGAAAGGARRTLGAATDAFMSWMPS